MTSQLTKPQILNFYKNYVRAASKFSDYNFRHYFLRKSRYEFENAKVVDLAKLEENLKILKNQSDISNMFAAEKTVMEVPWKDRINN